MVTYRNVTVDRLGHACVRIETDDGRVLYVNPWSEAIGSTENEADYVFVTDDDFDYFDPAGIEAVATESCTLVVYEEVDTTELDRSVVTMGRDPIDVDGMEVRAVPGRAQRQDARAGTGRQVATPEEAAVGLLLTVDETTLYLPGDVEFIDLSAAGEADVFIPPIGSYYASADQALPDFDDEEGPDLVLPVEYHTIKMVRRLIRDFEAFKANHERVEARLDDHEGTHETLQNTIGDLRDEVAAVGNRTADIDDQSMPLPEAVEHLGSLVAEAADDEAVHERIDDLEARLDDQSNTQEAAIEGLRDEIEARLQSLADRTGQHDDEIDQLHADLESARQALEEETAANDAGIEELRDELEQARASLEEQTSSNDAGIDELRDELEQTRARLEEQTATNDDHIDELRDEIEAARADLLDQLSSQADLDALEDEVDRLKQKIQDQKSDHETDIDELRAEMSELASRTVEVAGESVEIPTAIQQLSQSIQETREQIPDEDQLRAEIDSVRTELEALSGDLASIDARLESVETATADLDALEAQVDEVADDYRMIARAVAGLSSVIADTLRDLVDTMGEQADDLAGLQADLDRLETDFAELGPTSADGDALRQAHLRLEQTRERHQVPDDEVKSSLRRLSEQLAELRASTNGGPTAAAAVESRSD